MKDEHYFADVDLPFHVWVRERTPGRGFGWVLREAPRRDSLGSARQASCGDPGAGKPGRGA